MKMTVNKMKCISLSRTAIIMAAMTVLSSCGGGQSGMKLGDDEFTVMAVHSTASQQSTSYPATIKGIQDIEVRPQVSGFIVKLCVDEGATVRKGEALFQIDPTQYAAAKRQASAAVEMAKSNVNTLTLNEQQKKNLHDKNIISDFEYQSAVDQLLSAKASLAQAQAQLTSATQNLDFCTVTSPSNGVVGTFPYRVGSLVSPSVAQPLTTVSEIGDMYVYFSMTEKQLLAMTKAGGTLKDQLEKMPAVKLELADGTVYAEEGRIDAVSGVIDQSTGSVSMRALFPNKEHIVIRAHKHYIFKLIDTKPLHRSYEVVKPFGVYEDGEYAEFSVDVEMNNEFIGRVLQMGAGLEVMSPPKIRMIFATRVKDMVSYYLEHEEKLQRMVPNSEEPIGT